MNDQWYLIVASFFVACLSFIPLLTFNLAPRLLQTFHHQKQENYQVLVQQSEVIAPNSDRIPERAALSDVTSRGQGGITDNQGFHTGITGHDVFEWNEVQQNNAKQFSSLENTFIFYGYRHNTRSSVNRYKKIPENYYFRRDIALRFNDSGTLFIPRVKLTGYTYFRRLLSRLRDTFTFPGLNFIYRDRAGVVIGRSITPQVVKVLFALDYNGDVLDVRIANSIGDEKIDQACLDTLRDKNFGVPPRAIFTDKNGNGNIFGISFIFPPLRY